MHRRAHRHLATRRASLVLGPVVAVALFVGICAPVVAVAPPVTGATTGRSGAISGNLTPYAPGELWGGGNPAETCLSCAATSLIGEDAAESIQAGQPVDPATGDFTTHASLFSVPTAAGTLSLSLTYDAQRAISEGIDPTAYPTDERPGPFGWGWQSSLSASLVSTGTSVVVNEANGAQVAFRTIGKKSGDISTNACPREAGYYPDWQKHTVPKSSTAFCAAERVDAQLGTTTTHTQHLSWRFDVAGGAEDDTFDYFGQLTEDGNTENPNAVSLAYNVAQGTTKCPTTTTHPTTNCDIETDLVAEGLHITRRIVTELDGLRIATAVFAPTGAEYSFGQDPNGNALLTSITNPTGDTTHYGYAATRGTGARGYKNEMTSITDPDGYTSTVVYATGMVTQLRDPDSQYTVYTYANHDCGTFAGCFSTDASQTTVVTYEDGETDRDYYEGGVLLTNCYGPNAATCTNGAEWSFHYTFDTNTLPGGTNTETVDMPEAHDAVITTDAAGNVVAYTDPEGHTSHEMWNDTAGNDFDELCWSAGPSVAVAPSASCKSPPGGSSSSTFNADGEKLSTTNPTGDTTHYGYYDNGLLCWTAPPSAGGASTCANGGSTVPQGAPAGATTYRYDGDSDLIQTTVAYGTPTVATTTSLYDEVGRVTATIPPDGQGHGGFGANPYETTTTYRASGLVQTTTAPDARTTSYTYDPDGNVLTATTPSGVTTTAYDKENRACWTHVGTAKVTGTCENPPSGSIHTTYLATTSAPTNVTNQTNDTTTYTYGDALYPTKATKTADPMGDEVSYALYTVYGQTCVSGPVAPGTTCAEVAGDTYALYDADGQVATTVDPGGTPTAYTYADADFPSEPTKMTYGPGDDSRTTSYAYSADGTPVSTTDAEGYVTTSRYNADGELCFEAPVASGAACTSPPSATGVSTFSYNAAGERTSMTDNYGTANAVTDHYTYDAGGHLLTETTDNGRTTGYQYNDAGQVACIAYPVKSGANCANSPSATNTIVTHTFNAAGELDTTTDWLGNATSYSGYTPKGEVGQVTYPASTGESITYDHDTAGELTAIDYSGPAVGSATDSYGLNQDAQLSSATGLGGFSSPSDTYNDYGRVTSATAPRSATTSVKDTISYNTNGTIASVTPSSGFMTSNTYNTLDELTTRTTSGTVTVDNVFAGGSRVGTSPDAFAISPDGRVYTANTNSNSVTVVTATGGTTLLRRQTTVTVGTSPDAVAVTPTGGTVYVANEGSKSVTPISTEYDTAESPITVGTSPDAIAITPTGRTAYVANGTSASVTPITTAHNTAESAIAVGTSPDAIAITPTGRTAYVANGTSASVTPITTAANTAGAAIAVGTYPMAIAITPTGKTAYVVNETSASVTPITTAHNTAGSAISVGTSPDAIAITPTGRTAYVVDAGTRSVTPISTATNTAGSAIIVSAGKTFRHTDPRTIAVSSTGGTVYVMEKTRIIPITTLSNTAESAIRDLYTEGLSAIAFDATNDRLLAVGQIGSRTVEGLEISFTPSEVEHQSSTTRYVYNADGDRCWSAEETGGTCTDPQGGHTAFVWNSYNQLCSSNGFSGTAGKCTDPPYYATTYKYSGTGLRTEEKPYQGATLTFTYDTVTSTTPEDIDDGTYAYIYGPTGTAPVEQINLTTGAASFLSSTPTGVQAVFSSSGSLTEEAAYSPYGTQVIQEGSKATPFGFQGTYTTASGLDYMVNRYYTPTSAEFLSVDPMLGETHEPYVFANGDPLNESDPLGLKGWYCVATYNGTPGYSSHYFQKTKYGPPNGKCGTFLSWLSYQTQTTINYFETTAAQEQYAASLPDCGPGCSLYPSPPQQTSSVTKCPNTPTAPSAACATHSRQVWYSMQANAMETGSTSWGAVARKTLKYVDGSDLLECLQGAEEGAPSGALAGASSWVGGVEATDGEISIGVGPLIAIGTTVGGAFGCRYNDGEFPPSP